MEEPLHSCWNLLISPPVNRTCDGLGKVRLVGHFLKKHAQNSSKGPACKSLQQLQKNQPLMQKIKKQTKNRQHTNTFTRFVRCERGSCLPPQKKSIGAGGGRLLQWHFHSGSGYFSSWDLCLHVSWFVMGCVAGSNDPQQGMPKWLSQQKNRVGWCCNDFDIYLYIYTFIYIYIIHKYWHKRWYKQLL